MISTLLAENPTLVRALFVLAVSASTVLAWLLHRYRRFRVLTVLATVGLVGALALTLSPSSGQAAAFCTVQFSVPFQGLDTLANIALMLPLTLFAALRVGRPFVILAAVSSLSAVIELVQALVPTLGRACDTDDWFMNTVGAALAAMIALVIAARERTRSARPGRTPDSTIG